MLKMRMKKWKVVSRANLQISMSVKVSLWSSTKRKRMKIAWVPRFATRTSYLKTRRNKKNQRVMKLQLTSQISKVLATPRKW